MEYFALFKQRFDPLLFGYLKKKIEDTLPAGRLFEDMGERLLRYLKEGKRMRPALAYLASEEQVEALETSELLPVLYALELYHLFALVHDDIIDRSDTRHGEQALHALYGTHQAILLGDLMLSWAHECITETNDVLAAAIFAALSEETITGQMLDVALVGTIPATEDMVDRVIELKTARYSFIYPMFLGLAKGDNAEAVVRFGRLLGHAFQRLDDLADVFWDEDRLGKEPCSDFRNGTPTHLYLHMQTYGTPSERSRCSMLFGNADAETDAIRTLAMNTGAYARERELVERLMLEAADCMPSPVYKPCIAMLEEKLRMI
jgi:geranylgeranyl diphosphate synthase, type I